MQDGVKSLMGFFDAPAAKSRQAINPRFCRVHKGSDLL